MLTIDISFFPLHELLVVCAAAVICARLCSLSCRGLQHPDAAPHTACQCTDAYCFIESFFLGLRRGHYVPERPLLPVQLQAACALQMLQLARRLWQCWHECVCMVHTVASICMQSAFSSIQLNFHVIPALWGAEELAGQVQASPWGCPCAQSWSAVSWNGGIASRLLIAMTACFCASED